MISLSLEELHKEAIKAKKELRKKIRNEFDQRAFVQTVTLSPRSGGFSLMLVYTIGDPWNEIEYHFVDLV